MMEGGWVIADPKNFFAHFSTYVPSKKSVTLFFETGGGGGGAQRPFSKNSSKFGNLGVPYHESSSSILEDSSGLASLNF